MGKHRFEITEDGFKESTEYNEMFTKWEGIKSIEETKKQIFIFLDRHMAHIIPKRYFKNDEEVRELKEFLNSYINKVKN